MNPPNSPPSWVRQFNEDEEVWAAFERRRTLRALVSTLRKKRCELPGAEELSEQADWLAAEREVGRSVEAHGHRADER